MILAGVQARLGSTRLPKSNTLGPRLVRAQTLGSEAAVTGPVCHGCMEITKKTAGGVQFLLMLLLPY